VQVGDAKLDITELPIRKWTQDYKEFLEGLMKPENKDEVSEQSRRGDTSNGQLDRLPRRVHN
jgi:hypothetical protein